MKTFADKRQLEAADRYYKKMKQKDIRWKTWNFKKD